VENWIILFSSISAILPDSLRFEKIDSRNVNRSSACWDVGVLLNHPS
jgi:hypothetical protein